jgi:hypothetical protein
MPLPGGASDKFGNRYEGRWTVLQMAEVLAEHADLMRLEPPGEEGEGVEFWVRRSGGYEYHQVKRQHGADGRWTIASLNDRRVLQRFFEKLSDPSATCVFVSTHSTHQLDELIDRARRAASWAEYDRDFLKSSPLRAAFYELLSYWGNSEPAEAYERLKRVAIRTVDEETLRLMTEGQLAVLVEGQSPSAVAASLASYALDRVHHELSATDIWQHLESQGYRRREWNKDPRVLAAIEAQNGRYLGFLRDEAIGGELFPREEAQLAVDKLLSTEGKGSVMIAGEAGVGKSSVMPEIVRRLREIGWPVLAFRVDRMEPMPTPEQVGETLGLLESPAHVLAAVAQGRDCALVIDQLDAVSLASGRHPQFFECINEIIKQAQAYPRMHLVLGCRKFDINNDHRLRRLVEERGVAEVVTVNRLSHDRVKQIVTGFGFDATRLTGRQLDLLSVPLHLNLLSELATDIHADALNFETAKDLYDEFWKRKQALVRARLGRDLQWTQVMDVLCDYMSERQTLSAPEVILDEYAADASVMGSDHVLTWEGGRYSFFHESFFDYVFARRFAARGRRLLPFLLNGEQHLFRRAQVRQILLHEREQDRDVYLEDLSSLLFDERIRYHLKSATFAMLGDLAEPTTDEWDIVSRPLEDTAHQLYFEVWSLLHRSPAWFKLADSLGLIEHWLSDEDQEERVNKTVMLLRSTQRSLPDRVADLLEPKLGLSAAWDKRIAFVMQWSDMDINRRFFDLFLRAIDSGALDGIRGPVAVNSDFWDLSYDLPDKQPAWAAEVIGHFYDRCVTAALERGGDDTTTSIARCILDSARDRRNGYFSKAAGAAPREFVEQVLPIMLRVMQLTAQRAEEPPWPDAVWFYRSYGEGDGARDSLLEAMVAALSSLARNDPKAFAAYAARLRGAAFETARFLLLRAYAANGQRFADEATAYLLDDPALLKIGYAGGDHWPARLLLEAITPHCSEAELLRLEDLLLGYYTPWERSVEGHHAYGHAQFTLLEGITPARRSNRVRRRLEEWRRKFNKQSVEEPMRIVVGFVGSPIEDDAAAKMTDEQWLRAVERYDSDDVETRVLGDNLIGGAGQLAGLMEGLARQNPVRFAELAGRFPDSVNVRYFEAVLRGVADAGLDPQLALCLCKRCHALPSRPLGRWMPPVIANLAEAVLPDEVLEIVAWYATEDPDPEEELWRTPAYGGQIFFGGSIETAAINSARGVAAGAVGRLIFPDPARLRKLLPTVERMVDDASIAVRAGAARALIAVLKHDRDLAIRLFLRLCETEDELLRTDGVETFMRYGVRTHYETLSPILDRMLTSEHSEANLAGARLACIAALFVEQARAAAESCVRGNEVQRQGAAQVLAANLGQARFRRFCEENLTTLFDDASEDVRSKAARCFGHLGEEQLGDYVALIDAFTASEAFVGEHGSLFRALDKTTAQLPDITCAAAERFFDVVGSDAADISTHAAAESFMVTKLVVRIYAQSRSPVIQTRCLDIIDRVARIQAIGLSEAISDYER